MNYHDQKIRRTFAPDIRKPWANKVETAVQCFCMSCVSVHRIFLVRVILFRTINPNLPMKCNKIEKTKLTKSNNGTEKNLKWKIYPPIHISYL